MANFWDMLERSIIVQSLITLTLVGVSCYMYVSGRQVSEGLQTLTYTVVAFWMGTKVEHAVVNARRRDND